MGNFGNERYTDSHIRVVLKQYNTIHVKRYIDISFMSLNAHTISFESKKKMCR